MSNLTKAFICVVTMIVVASVTMIVYMITPEHSGVPMSVGMVLLMISSLSLGMLFDPKTM